MNTDLKQIEKSINKKHSFGWTPKYQDDFNTTINSTVFIPIVIQVFEKLGWDLVHQDELTAEAKRKGTWNSWTEKISVTYDSGNIKVKSVSLGNEMWDNGRNSKRVRLFIYTFKETEKDLDEESLKKLENEIEIQRNWDDYEIPEILPQPERRRSPNFLIPVIGGFFIALILGFILAFLTFKRGYVLGLFEVGVGFAIGFGFKYLIRFSNFVDFKKLNYLLIGVIILTYIANQYFLYELILDKYNYERIGFHEFIKLRFKEGLTIKSLNTGWIGLVISWLVQLGLTWLISYLRIASNLTSYLLERVPLEVVDFAFYHFIKEKTEDQVRVELTSKGWSDKQNQDEVFESIGAIYSANELNRME